MSHSSRQQNRADGPATLSEGKESVESTGGGPDSRSEQFDNPHPGEADPFRAGLSLSPSLLGYLSRSPLFRTVSGSSSGYFSFDCDSVPSSPLFDSNSVPTPLLFDSDSSRLLMTHNKSTQTPSPSCQVITHALQRIPQAQDSGPNHEEWPAPGDRQRAHTPPPPERVMQREVSVGVELRRIGDEYNRLYLPGGALGRSGALALCLGLLIGRLLQMFLRRR